MINRERYLAIDDIRECGYCNIVARTYHDGIAALTQLGPWDCLYLDHDLGAIHQQYDDNGNELNGYKVVCFLEENPQYQPPFVTIISSNPTGRLNIERALMAMGYEKDGNTWRKPSSSG